MVNESENEYAHLSESFIYNFIAIQHYLQRKHSVIENVVILAGIRLFRQEISDSFVIAWRQLFKLHISIKGFLGK